MIGPIILPVPLKQTSDQKSPANTKRNVRQRCMCEGPVQTKSKFTTMFHLDSKADDAQRHIQCINFSTAHHVQCMNSNIGWKTQIFPTPTYLATSFGVTTFQIYGKALRFMKLKSSR